MLKQHLDILKGWSEGEALGGKGINIRMKYYPELGDSYLSNRVMLPFETPTVEDQKSDELEAAKRA